MEGAFITFTQIKDFLFSPATTYLQNIYREFAEEAWKGEALVAGKQAHSSIDYGNYTKKRDVLVGKTAYWSEQNVGGKIDIYSPSEGGVLVERKRFVDRVWLGDRAQLYAQYFALREEGLPIRRLAVHSLSTNRRFYIDLPSDADKAWLVGIVAEMRRLALEDVALRCAGDERASRSIYAGLSW